METVTKSWVVMGFDKTKKKVLQLSRPYHVKDAADQFASLCEKSGIQEVSVKAVTGMDNVNG